MTEQNEEQPVTETGMVSEVTGKNVMFGPGLASTVSAQGDLVMTNSLAANVKSTGGMEIQNSLSASMVAGGDLKVTNGIAQAMVAGGSASLDKAQALVVVAGNTITANKSLLGVVITDHVELHDDSRILLDQPRAIAFGAAFGVVFALLSWLLRRH